MKYISKEKLMSAKEYVDGMLEKVKPVVWYFVSGIVIILITAWFTGSAAANSVDKVIDSRIDARINEKLALEVVPLLKEMNAKLDLSLDVQYTEQVRQINKTIEAMKKDPGDVKSENVKVILERWNALPEKYKTDDVKIKYEAIKRWYEGSVK